MNNKEQLHMLEIEFPLGIPWSQHSKEYLFKQAFKQARCVKKLEEEIRGRNIKLAYKFFKNNEEES